MPRFLNCYSLTGADLTPGIPVGIFDSIVAKPGDTLVSAATLLLFPLLEHTAGAKILSTASLAFAQSGALPTKPSADILLSANATEWALYKKQNSVELIDPCGAGNRVLLLCRQSSEPVLVSRARGDGPRFLIVDTSGPTITSQPSVGNYLFAALTQQPRQFCIEQTKSPSTRKGLPQQERGKKQVCLDTP